MDYQLLVNKNFHLDKDYIPIDLMQFNSFYKNNILLNKTVYDNFLKLRKTVLKKGYQMEVESGYRDYSYQKKIYDDLVLEKGEAYAKIHVAIPGCSEHQTGLCLDFCLYKDGECFLEHDMKNLEIINYIHHILPKYGFILRYPKGKEEITGYDYEPWHIRYVGKDLASYLYQNNLTLDEFLEK